MGRPILSVLHGMWSFGLLAGSGIAAGAAAAAISPRVQFPVVAAAALVLVAIFVPRLLPGTAADVDSAHFALPRGALALPAFLTFCAFFVEFGGDELERGLPRGAGARERRRRGRRRRRLRASPWRSRGSRATGCSARWGIGGLARRSGSARRASGSRSRSRPARPCPRSSASRSSAPAAPRSSRRSSGSAARCRASRRAPASPRSRPRATRGAVVNGPAIGFLARGIGLQRRALADRRRRGAHRAARSASTRLPRVKVGVVGLGAMGAGIAQLCVEAGVDTVGREVSLELARERARPHRALPHAQGREGPARAGRARRRGRPALADDRARRPRRLRPRDRGDRRGARRRSRRSSPSSSASAGRTPCSRRTRRRSR